MISFEKALDLFISLKGKIPEKSWRFIWFLVNMVFLAWVLIKFSAYFQRLDWSYNYNEEMELAVFTTDTKLKKSSIIVSPRIEVKYKGKIVYILEIQGLYNINNTDLQIHNSDTKKTGTEAEGTEMHLILEAKQKLCYDKFYEMWEELLQEYWKEKCGEDFKAEDLEIRRQQLVLINYQMLKSNKGDTMYLCISDNEIRNITKNEARLKNKTGEIDLDEINFEESFYTNGKILDLVRKCFNSAKG